MKCYVFVKGNKESEAGVMPSEDLIEKMGAFNMEMANAGILLEAEGLRPSSAGIRIDYDDGSLTVTNGPFAHPTELVEGLWVLDVKSVDEAVKWMRKAPFCGGTLEIRPCATWEDFGETLTPELREQEAKLVELMNKAKA